MERSLRRISFICIKYGVFCLTSFLAISCNNSDNNAEPPVEEVTLDSAQTAKSIREEDSAKIFNNNAEWLTKNLKNNSINWNKFKLTEFWGVDSLEKRAFVPAADFYKNYASVLRWSPDSSFVLDIGSYGSVLVKDKAGKMSVAGGEPDTEVSMINTNEKTKSRLLFLGASSEIFDSKWIDSSQVAIMGTVDEKGNNMVDTLMWLVDVKQNFFRKYRYLNNTN
jgi:hypothetical protein